LLQSWEAEVSSRCCFGVGGALWGLDPHELLGDTLSQIVVLCELSKSAVAPHSTHFHSSNCPFMHHTLSMQLRESRGKCSSHFNSFERFLNWLFPGRELRTLQQKAVET
jgi:hypothetical protein